MEKEIKNNIQNDPFKKLLSPTQISASDNLRFRIMQQIETEKALSRMQKTSSMPILKNMLTVLGVMYGLIAFVVFMVYSMSGKAGLESSSVLMALIAIVSVCLVFWMISIFDDQRRVKKKRY